jgi:hypothetical protein
MKYFYSPHTGELIATDTPADWMGRTDIAPPAFDPSTCGAFFIGGTWELRLAEQPNLKAEVDAKLTKVRAVREAILNRMGGIAYALDDPATTAGYRSARLSLLDITTGCPTDPALVDAFILGKYVAIAAALPDSLVKAFAGMHDAA